MSEEDSASKNVSSDNEKPAEIPQPVEPNKANYGLFQLKKTALGTKIARPSIFSIEDSEEKSGESSEFSVNLEIRPKVDVTRKSKKADEVLAARALVEDPSVFSYDEIYEKMQKQKEKKTAEMKKLDKDRRPKYIETMVETAKRRQRDFEAHVERMQQKERIKEGNVFAEKEIFVTANYRKKMEEIAKFEAEERQREMLEEISDVTKRKEFAFTGFYKNYLEEQTRLTAPSEPEPEIKEEPKESEPETSSKFETSSRPENPEKFENLGKSEKSKKIYRTRNQSENESPPPTPKRATENEKKKPDLSASPLNSNEDSDSDENRKPERKENQVPQLKAGLNFIRKKKSPSPAPKFSERNRRDYRRRSRSHSGDKVRSSSRNKVSSMPSSGDKVGTKVRKRYKLMSKPSGWDERSHRDRDGTKDRGRDEKRDSKRRRTRSGSGTRSKSPSGAEKNLKKNETSPPPKKKVDTVEERLEKWREIFKPRNTLEQIDSYRQRFFERLSEKN